MGSLVTGFGEGTDTGESSVSGEDGGSTDGRTATGTDDTTGEPPGSSGSDGTTGGGTEDLPPWCGDTIPAAGAEPLIDDLEVEPGQMLPDDQIPAVDGRVGFWFTYNDGSMNGRQTPPRGAFQPSMGGADGTSYSAGTFGQGFTTWGAGMGVKLNNDFGGDCPYDVSAFEGLSFWARGNVPVRLSITTRATHPIDSGGTCDPMMGQCSDHFGVSLVLTPDWELFTISWDELAQQGWGIPAKLDPAKVIEVQWQAPVAIPFDVQVDELSLWSP